MMMSSLMEVRLFRHSVMMVVWGRGRSRAGGASHHWCHRKDWGDSGCGSSGVAPPGHSGGCRHVECYEASSVSFDPQFPTSVDNVDTLGVPITLLKALL
jgi:hypothetical protein